MPKLWSATIEAHRQAVRDATLDAAASLVAEHGLASLTMSEIAEKAGLGRATLYKYFPDVETILVEWHQRHVAGHLEYLTEVRDTAANPEDRLKAVLRAYALLGHGHPENETAAYLHQLEHVARARQQLRAFLEELLAEAVDAGHVRDDVPPAELADYCLGALSAAGRLTSEAAIDRLLSVVLDGLRSTA